jgi:hypothetical protein
VVYSGPEKEKPVTTRQAVVDGVPGLWNFDAAGNPTSKAADIYQTPSAGRQPTNADLLEAELVKSGIPPGDARKMRLGLMDIPGKTKSGGRPSKFEQDRMRRDEALAMSNTQIDRLLSGPDLQDRSGFDTAVTKLARPIAGFFGGSTGGETTRLETELALLKQNIREVVNPESNYESKVFWERLEPLFPKVDAGSSAQSIRNKLVTIRRLLNEKPGQAEGEEPPMSIEDARRAISGESSGGRMKFNPQTGEIE